MEVSLDTDFDTLYVSMLVLVCRLSWKETHARVC
jgi:hypothetical protein